MDIRIKIPARLRPFKMTGGIILILEWIYGKSKQQKFQAYLEQLPKGTVGREVADLLSTRNYRLIPKFENHDLKHIVLGYAMTMPDEIRMQAYLIGNGNRTWPCLLFLLLGIFYPSAWKDLPGEFKRGRAAPSIYHLTLRDCMRLPLNDILARYSPHVKEPAVTCSVPLMRKSMLNHEI